MTTKKELYDTKRMEIQEDDTLMGRLAKRMQARDYIDSVSSKGNAPKAPTAESADGDQGIKAPSVSIAEADIPRRMNLGGPAKRKQ